jgi:hypothetical protein
MAPVSEPVAAERLTVVPANEASCDDLDAIFGTTDYPGRCRCQRFKVVGWIWRDSTQEERAAALRAQTACSHPDAAATSGLVAYVDDQPAGWVAVDFARERGARALEAYPMITHPGKEITWGEVHVGPRQVFADAGFEEVSRPTVRRAVMRIDFEQRSDAR